MPCHLRPPTFLPAQHLVLPKEITTPYPVRHTTVRRYHTLTPPSLTLTILPRLTDDLMPSPHPFPLMPSPPSPRYPPQTQAYSPPPPLLHTTHTHHPYTSSIPPSKVNPAPQSLPAPHRHLPLTTPTPHRRLRLPHNATSAYLTPPPLPTPPLRLRLPHTSTSVLPHTSTSAYPAPPPPPTPHCGLRLPHTFASAYSTLLPPPTPFAASAHPEWLPLPTAPPPSPALSHRHTPHCCRYQLAGAHYGEAGLPAQWVESLFFSPLLTVVSSVGLQPMLSAVGCQLIGTQPAATLRSPQSQRAETCV